MNPHGSEDTFDPTATEVVCVQKLRIGNFLLVIIVGKNCKAGSLLFDMRDESPNCLLGIDHVLGCATNK
jgi:hypothetical protein